MIEVMSREVMARREEDNVKLLKKNVEFEELTQHRGSTITEANSRARRRRSARDTPGTTSPWSDPPGSRSDS
jgi:hypothetical protein